MEVLPPSQQFSVCAGEAGLAHSSPPCSEHQGSIWFGDLAVMLLLHRCYWSCQGTGKVQYQRVGAASDSSSN